MSGRTSELDRWARVLAVGNDGDAVAELNRLGDHLQNLAYLLLRLEKSLRDAPDRDVLEAVRRATQDAINLWSSVTLIKRKFEAHERGGK